MDVLLTTQEAAERAGVGTTAIKRWADTGILPCVRTAGGHRRFRERDVLALLEEQGTVVAEAETESKGELDAWIDALVVDGNPYTLQSKLLAERARGGTWSRVATLMGELLTEIGLRWERGALSIMQEHLASERLQRALARASESIPIPDGAPVALLACVEGEDHTLGLACVELCLREAGWNTRWSGRMTPVEEIAASIEGGMADMVAASASSHAKDRMSLARWAKRVAEVCERRGITLVLGGRGAWPDAPSYGARFEGFEEFRKFLLGLGRPRRPR